MDPGVTTNITLPVREIEPWERRLNVAKQLKDLKIFKVW